MIEKRQHPRLPLSMQVKIEHPEAGSRIATTENISDGGLFVKLADPQFLIEDKISVQACDMEDAPVVQGRIIRVEQEGIGVAFDEGGAEQ